MLSSRSPLTSSRSSPDRLVMGSVTRPVRSSRAPAASADRANGTYSLTRRKSIRVPLETRDGHGGLVDRAVQGQAHRLLGQRARHAGLQRDLDQRLALHIAHREVPAVQVDLQRRLLEHLAQPAAAPDELHAQRLHARVEVLHDLEVAQQPPHVHVVRRHPQRCLGHLSAQVQRHRAAEGHPGDIGREGRGGHPPFADAAGERRVRHVGGLERQRA